MGYFVSKPVPWGERMPIEDAKQHIFGFVLLNDWSARDHQLFEMRPLVRIPMELSSIRFVKNVCKC
jgi:fumarylacetoacetase